MHSITYRKIEPRASVNENVQIGWSAIYWWGLGNSRDEPLHDNHSPTPTSLSKSIKNTKVRLYRRRMLAEDSNRMVNCQAYSHSMSKIVADLRAQPCGNATSAELNL